MEEKREPDVLLAGTRVGHYEIVELLGRGGMGVVHRARDLNLDREVALKRPLKRALESPNTRKRFYREAQAASRLLHPHIVTIFEVFQEDGCDWMSMELVEGESLAAHIRNRGPLRQTEVLSHGEGLAAALQEAHNQDVLHRDIKPSNILLDRNRFARLTDFGLAYVRAAIDAETDDETVSLPITSEGVLLGTAAYMSPEQALGKRVDARTDIFSLGVVLYEMCTGTQAFAKESKSQTLDAILHYEPTAIPILNHRVSSELVRIINKCLAKRPDERYQDAGDLLADLRAERRRVQSETYDSEHPSSESERAPSRRWLPAAVATVLGTVLVGMMVLVWSREDAVPESRPRQVTALPGWEAEVAISPGGDLLAYSSNESGDEEIWLVDVRGGNSVRLTVDPNADRSPAWFPDGSALAYQSNREGATEIWKVPKLGGPSTMLVADAADPAISPDGRQIAFAILGEEDTEARIGVLELERPGEIQILTDADDGLWGHRNPAWSPDGKWLCYNDFSDLWLIPASGGSAKQLTSDAAGDSEPAWSPSGEHIYFSSKREGTLALWRVRSQGGQPQRITVGTGPERHPSLSRSGIYLAYTTFVEQFDVEIVDLETGERTKLAGTRTDYGASFTPSGDAFVFVSNRSGVFNLWRQSIEGMQLVGEPKRLNDELEASSNPVVSPDGHWIAYQRTSGADRNIYLLPVDGGVPRPLTEGSGVRIHPTWAPDGAHIAFTSHETQVAEINILPILDGVPTEPARAVATGVQQLMWPKWSPDGRHIAYLGVKDEKWEVWLASLSPETPPRKLTSDSRPVNLAWRPGGETLLVSGFWNQDNVTLRELDVATGETALMEMVDFGPKARYGIFGISGDDRRLAMTHENLSGDIWVLEAKEENW